MRWVVNYLRQCFCRHDFEKEEGFCKESSDWGATQEGRKVSLLCKKCGYHRSFWKF